MAVPAWATNLTTFWLETTGSETITAKGGGGMSAIIDTDMYIETSECVSGKAFTNSTKGFVIDALGTTFTVPTDGAVIGFMKYDAAGSLGTQSAGGMRMCIGSGSSAYDEFYVGGNDTLAYDSWVPYVVDPNTATADVANSGGAEQWVGMLVYLPSTSGPTKGNPMQMDSIRYGRCDLEYTAGESADYNTFAKAEAYANATTRRWGLMELQGGAYQIQGFHSFGTSGTAVDFRDSNKVLFWRKQENNGTNDAISTAFNRIEVLNSSSNVDWDNIIIQALGTRSLGTFVHTAGTWDCNVCQFVDVGTFSLLSTSVFNNCVFRNTGVITAPGSSMIGSQVIGYEGTANTSALVWNVATDPITNLADMTFEMGSAATHAIEFGTSSPLTMTLTDCVFTGYDTVDNNQNDSTFDVKRGSGTVTINISGSGATAAADLTYRTAGATVVITGSVTVTITVKDIDGNLLTDVQTAVFDSSGTEIFNKDTVTGVASGSYSGSTPDTATVRCRKSSTGTRYRNFSTQATITSDGLALDVTLQEDAVV